MPDESQQHDEPVLPDDAVEDLSPEDADQEVGGGADDYFLKLDGIKGESQDDKH